ncbi:MAG: hypothetical protein ACRENB_10990, partial [Gemmatimonadales bacterium]
MLLPLILLLLVVATTVLYRYLLGRPDTGALWRSALRIGLAVGALRALAASAGWYVTERTAGRLQVPGFALAMLSWPEGVLLDVSRGPAPATFFFRLGVTLIVSTTMFAFAVAWLASARRKRRP